MRFRHRDSDGEQVGISERILVQLETNNERASAADIDIDATNTVCQGGAATITASVNNNNPAFSNLQNLRFFLYEDGTSILREQKNSPPYTFTVYPAVIPTTTYYVSFSADGVDGNLPTDRKRVDIDVTANVIPTVAITINTGGQGSANALNPYAGDIRYFVANPTNGGQNPTYEWRDNGITIPDSIGSTYSTSWTNAETGGHVITCIMTPSPEVCVSSNSTAATSNPISITVTYVYDQNSCDDCKKFLADQGVNIHAFPYYNLWNAYCIAWRFDSGTQQYVGDAYTYQGTTWQHNNSSWNLQQNQVTLSTCDKSTLYTLDNR